MVVKRNVESEKPASLSLLATRLSFDRSVGAMSGAGHEGGGPNLKLGGGGGVCRGARAKPNAASAAALPQEAVTPTRRDLRSTNVDWIPVSLSNSRPSQNRSRKPINALPENNEYVEIDTRIIPENSNRFVPVRPQPRTLVLRQRDMMDNQEDSPYNAILGGHSPHTSHAAIMIVNPTTPNSNIPNQNNLTNGRIDPNENKSNSRNVCANHEANSNKSTNICSDGHNGELQHSESMPPHSKTARSLGDSLINACPDVSRVEQRLGEIQEYIRVTASLVDSMRNSEDEDFDRERENDLSELEQTLKNLKDSEKKLENMLQTTLCSNGIQDGDSLSHDNPQISEQDAQRSYSVQSGGSVYSDNDLWQNDMKMEISQMHAAFQEEQKKMLIKYQSEMREKADGNSLINDHFENGLLETGNSYSKEQACNSQQPLAIPSTSRQFSSNQIGVATTLPHVQEDKDCAKNLRRYGSQERESVDSSASREVTMSNLNKPSLSNQVFVSEAGMLINDLKMRRQHLENQVAKIQSLHAATASLVEAVAEQQSGLITPDDQSLRGTGVWEESEGSIAEDDSIVALCSLKSKMQAVNVVKLELEKLKNMLRTVDSIQNSINSNSVMENENSYSNLSTQAQQLSQNQPSESTYNNIIRNKMESLTNTNVNQHISQSPKNSHTQQGLSRLQNCISSGSNKCTNVNDQDQQRHDTISAGLATIQQLTQRMKQETQEINNERRRLKHAYVIDTNNSSSSSIKSDDKKRSNSMEKGSLLYPADAGPVERKHLALKAELEAKKKQLERLMSKEVDHRTNQQTSQSDAESTSKTLCPSDNSFISPEAGPSASQSSISNRFDENDVFPCLVKSEIDNEYSSDQDDEYAISSLSQVNINQLNDRCIIKRSSQNPSLENFKINYDPIQSIDNSNQNIKQKNNQSGLYDSTGSDKQINHVDNSIPHCSRQNKTMPLNQNTLLDICNESRNLLESCQKPRANSRDVDNSSIKSQPPSTHLAVLSTNSPSIQTKQSKDIHPNVDSIEMTSHLDSGSSSGDQELVDIPNPMPELSMRHSLIKNDQEKQNISMESRSWQDTHTDSHMAVWWHNKATQLQQQLEMINSLCQSLLQDRNINQSSPSVPSNMSHMMGNTAIVPNYPANFMLPYGFNNSCTEQMSMPWWAATQQQLALQQQQLAAQQQQLAATTWSNSQCIQHLLSQQREISTLKNTVQHLEEKFQMLLNPPRANSTPPEVTTSSTQDNPTYSRMQNWNPSHTNSLKKTPMVPSYIIDHVNMNNHPSVNVYSSHGMLNDQITNQIAMSVAPNNINIASQPGIVYNNCIPSNQLNPNMQNNVNTNSLLNMPLHNSIHNTHPAAMHALNSGNSQPLSGQSMALNNQVAPGNRANNYWDNFRSYSRQNLLSGNKTNAETVVQLHNHHPLPERSNNTLRPNSSIVPSQTQTANTPKRNLNNQLGNSTINQLHNNPNLQVYSQENNTRGRRNLSNEISFSTPPDIVNMNSETTSNASGVPVNLEDCNRTINSINLNINTENVSNTDPELLQSASNNLNTQYLNQKKKSSSKLPAKNSSSSGNYSLETIQNKNARTAEESHNLASTSSSTKQKSPAKLFDLLRENVYSEVSALISANESRPHFLIQLFRDLQQISSDTLRQRTLQSIQELVTRYLSTVETESYQSDDQKNRVTSSNDDHLCPANSNDETGIFTLDNNNEIIRFILAHHADVCTGELLQSLRSTIYSIIGDIPDKVDENLLACFNKYPGCTLMDIGDELIMVISRINIDCKKKMVDGHVADSGQDRENDGETNQQMAESDNDTELPAHLVGGFNDASEMASCSNSSVLKHPEISSENAACSSSYSINAIELKIDLIESVETCNGDLAEADQSRHGSDSINVAASGGFENLLPDIVDMDEQTPTEAEAEWLRMDRMSSHMDNKDCIGPQNDSCQS